jgi:uncharacterized protein YndB with AHSA1/START domain
MTTIRHQVLIDAPVAKVYQALSTAEGISTWWDKQTPTQTDPASSWNTIRVRNTEWCN